MAKRTTVWERARVHSEVRNTRAAAAMVALQKWKGRNTKVLAAFPDSGDVDAGGRTLWHVYVELDKQEAMDAKEMLSYLLRSGPTPGFDTRDEMTVEIPGHDPVQVHRVYHSSHEVDPRPGEAYEGTSLRDYPGSPS